VKFARVIGNLVATQKYQGLDGVKFLVVQPLDASRQPDGEPYVAVDATHQAGLDELVFVIASKEAAFALPNNFVPVDAAVVGIVDDVDDRPLYDADRVAWKVFLNAPVSPPSPPSPVEKARKARSRRQKAST
jgi:ethanolamine utilization protein EutN